MRKVFFLMKNLKLKHRLLSTLSILGTKKTMVITNINAQYKKNEGKNYLVRRKTSIFLHFNYTVPNVERIIPYFAEMSCQFLAVFECLIQTFLIFFYNSI